MIDFHQLAAHADDFRGDLLFSCLGTTLRQAGSRAARRQVDLAWQLEAARLAAAGGVRHCLLVSSAFANARSPIDYLQLKGELEERVQALPFERISIFQPSLLLGNRVQPRPGEALAGWLMPAVCRLPGLRRCRPITGEEVAAKMVAVSQQPGPRLQWFSLDGLFEA